MMPTEEESRAIVLVWVMALVGGLLGLAVNWWVQRRNDEE